MSGRFAMRLMILIVLAAGIAVPMLPGCGQQHGAGAESGRSGSESAEGIAPRLVVTFDAGRPADFDSRSSGVRLAVWDDGMVLRAADPLHPDRDMRVGRLTSEQFAIAWSAFERSGFFSQSDMFLVAPDSAYVRVTARSDGVTRTHMLDAYHLSQTAWWPSVEAALEQFRPEDTRPVAEAAKAGAFRGFIVAEWWRTPWAR